MSNTREAGPTRHATIAVMVVALLLASLAAWLWTPDLTWERLEARYLESRADLVEVDGSTLHVRVRGPAGAPAVIFVHGFGSSLQTWDAWAEGLARDHRTVRLDLPGSGLSRPDPRGDYTDARSVASLLALMDRLGLPKASLVGHSIGGRIAWTFAAAHPDRIDRLVLVAPDGFASPPFAYGRAPEMPFGLGLVRQVLPKALVGAGLRQAWGDPDALPAATLARYAELIRAPGARQTMLDRLRQTVLVDPRPRLAAIAAPTLLVWGGRDRLIPIANAADYLAALPDARLASFPTAGHLPQEEVPAESLASVAAFLAP